MIATNPALMQPLIFGGSAGENLADEVCRLLELKKGVLDISRFADGEIGVKILDNVRGRHCYLIQPTCGPVNENLMEMLLVIDAMVRASAGSISVIIPYFGYARQDRKDQGRVALSAKLVANLITKAGASRVICLDLHSAQIQGFFDIPVDHLYGGTVLIDYIRKQKWAKDLVVVSPDVGNVKMARAFASRLDAPFAIVDKRRPRANVSEVLNIVGQVDGRHCLLVDDLIDTAGTLVNGAQALMEKGATAVSACATHAVLSGEARERIQKSVLQRVIVTDSIPQNTEKPDKKLVFVPVSPLLAETIQRIHSFESVSSLFDKYTLNHVRRKTARAAAKV